MYFDYAATSKIRKDVLEKLIKEIDVIDANPSSIHALGKKSRIELDRARKIIAEFIGVKSDKVVFTSGATESNNMVVNHFSKKGNHIISTSIEHKSMLEPLKRSKAEVVFVDAKENGRVDIEEIRKNITKNTKLVSVMFVNNETGIIQSIKEIGEMLKDTEIWFHVDAVQALGHLDINVDEMGIDSLSLSGHKIGGMNSFGVLYIRENIDAMILGGSQEKSIRAGTSNTMAALSMAYSLEKIKEEQEDILEIKKYFIENLKDIPHEINGNVESSVNHIVNIYFPFVKSDLLLTYLDLAGIYVSAGSACNANTLEPSYVIANMYDMERAKHSVRFSFGYENTKEEVDYLVQKIKEMYDRKSN